MATSLQSKIFNKPYFAKMSSHWRYEVWRKELCISVNPKKFVWYFPQVRQLLGGGGLYTHIINIQNLTSVIFFFYTHNYSALWYIFFFLFKKLIFKNPKIIKPIFNTDTLGFVMIKIKKLYFKFGWWQKINKIIDKISWLYVYLTWVSWIQSLKMLSKQNTYWI